MSSAARVERGGCLYSCDLAPASARPRSRWQRRPRPRRRRVARGQKMTVYGAGRPPRKPKRRRWVRIALWSFASIFLVLLAGAGAVAYWLYGDYTRITSNSHDVKLATKDGRAAARGERPRDRPRDRLRPSLHQTAPRRPAPTRWMLVRIDPAHPPDLAALAARATCGSTSPASARTSINAAFSDGGGGAERRGSSRPSSSSPG